MTLAEGVTLLLGLLGVAGVIFTAMRYNRDDTTALVNQQSILVRDMEVVMTQLRAENARLEGRLEELRGTAG